MKINVFQSTALLLVLQISVAWGIYCSIEYVI